MSVKIAESRLRQIIREELNEMMGSQDLPGPRDLKILGYEWNEEYNDPEMGTQQGDLKVKFSLDGEEMEAIKTFTSFISHKRMVVEDIAFAINEMLENAALDRDEELDESDLLDEATVESALGPNMLNDIMAELAESQRAYQAQPDANSRYY